MIVIDEKKVMDPRWLKILGIITMIDMILSVSPWEAIALLSVIDGLALNAIPDIVNEEKEFTDEHRRFCLNILMISR